MTKDSLILNHKVALVRCSSHTLNLVLKDYVKCENLEPEVRALLSEYNINFRLRTTRWTSYDEAFRKILK